MKGRRAALATTNLGVSSWEKAIGQDGVLASICDAHCIFAESNRESLLNKKVRKRSGVKSGALLDTDELYSIGTVVKPSLSERVNAQLCTFRSGPYIQHRDARRCHIDGCLRSGVSISLFGTSTKRCRVHIEGALMAIATGQRPHVAETGSKKDRRETNTTQFFDPQVGGHTIDDEPPPMFIPSSRRPSQNSLDSGGVSASSSISETCATLGQLHTSNRKKDGGSPTCWDQDIPNRPVGALSLSRPSLGTTWSRRGSGHATPPGLIPPLPIVSTPTLPVPYPGLDPCLSCQSGTGHLDLRGLMPTSVKRPRGGIHPDTYPSGTLNRQQQPISGDPMELMIERMGELSNSSKDVKIVRFHEYAVFAVRRFGSFKTTQGAGCYGSDLEASLGRQSVTHREIPPRQGIRAPVTNRIAQACPTLEWGIDYVPAPGSGTLMLSDFIPWPATKLDEFRIRGDKLETRGKYLPCERFYRTTKSGVR